MEDNNAQHEEPKTFDWFDSESMYLAQLNDDIIWVRSAIVDTLTEIENILGRQNPRIEVEWQLVVGVWENKLLEAQIAMRRARRKCSLLQASVNAGEPIDESKVEAQLDEELAEWTQQLADATQRYETATVAQLGAVEISSADDKAQRKLFRILAKRLHPDLHPDQDEDTRAMFALADLAYRQGDMQILQSLEASTRNLETGSNLPTTVEEAKVELEALKKQKGEIDQRLEQIKADKPYCLRQLLSDSNWVEQCVAQMKQEIENYEQTAREYGKRNSELAAGDE